MSKIFDHQEVHDFFDWNSKCVFSDLEFYHCKFTNCNVSVTKNPKRRSIITRSKFVGCEVLDVNVYAAIVEDVLISDLRTHNKLMTNCAVFKHVKLEGKIGKVLISPLIEVWKQNTKEQRRFTDANNEYYKKVDWALDISEAHFLDCSIRGIPSKFIKRDPASQAVVTREKAITGAWKQLDLSKTYWKTVIEFLLDRQDVDVVLVAPKCHPHYSDLIEGIEMLRDAGVAEPD